MRFHGHASSKIHPHSLSDSRWESLGEYRTGRCHILDGQPTEEEALMVMGYGDDSSVPVPAIFMFVPGMPVVVDRNTYPGLKLVNGLTYRALDVVLDKAYPGHRVPGDTTLYLGCQLVLFLRQNRRRILTSSACLLGPSSSP